MAEFDDLVKGFISLHHANEYDDSQARADDGKWTDGGGGTRKQKGGRAPKGGVIGQNDMFYPGGSFVASTELPKMTAADKKAKKYLDTKQEVAPFTYEKPPSADHISVYQAAGVGVRSKLDHKTGKLSKNEIFKGMDGMGFDWSRPVLGGFSTDELIDKFNNGERWTLPREV